MESVNTIYSLRSYDMFAGGERDFIRKISAPRKFTEQKKVFCYNRGGTASFEEAIKHEWLTESELKAFYETYRAAHPELYN